MVSWIDSSIDHPGIVSWNIPQKLHLSYLPAHKPRARRPLSRSLHGNPACSHMSTFVAGWVSKYKPTVKNSPIFRQTQTQTRSINETPYIFLKEDEASEAKRARSDSRLGLWLPLNRAASSHPKLSTRLVQIPLLQRHPPLGLLDSDTGIHESRLTCSSQPNLLREISARPDR